MEKERQREKENVRTEQENVTQKISGYCEGYTLKGVWERAWQVGDVGGGGDIFQMMRKPICKSLFSPTIIDMVVKLWEFKQVFEVFAEKKI